MADLRRHSRRLDDALQYDDDLEVLVRGGAEVVGADVPQRTGLRDAVLDDDRPDEEQSTLVVALVVVAATQRQLALVDRQHLTLARHALAY